MALEVNDDAAALTRTELDRRGFHAARTAVGDVHALEFDDASFDVVHAHQVLQHVADPVRALREMKRVTAPGGVIAVRDSDYDMFTWHPTTPALDDWNALYHRLARASGGEPDAGRHYRAWANAAGLTDVTITSTTWTYADPETVAWWAGLWQERVLNSRFATDAEAAGVGRDELARLADGWRQWGDSRDALFALPSMELLARV